MNNIFNFDIKQLNKCAEEVFVKYQSRNNLYKKLNAIIIGIGRDKPKVNYTCGLSDAE